MKYAEVDLAASRKKIADNEKKMAEQQAGIDKNKPIAEELEATLEEKVCRHRLVSRLAALSLIILTYATISFASFLLDCCR